MFLLNDKLSQKNEIIQRKNEKKCLNDLDYKIFIHLALSSFASAKICDTPKMHNLTDSVSFPALQPITITSSPKTFNQNFAKYLWNFLSPHRPENYCTKATFKFVEELKWVGLVDRVLVSFDVTILFTNILLSETIKLTAAHQNIST